MKINSCKPVKIEPVRKQLRVGLSVEQAFELFTAGIGKWWPLADSLCW